MKKLINDPHDVVVESLKGFQAAHADLVTIDAGRGVVRRAAPSMTPKVAVVSGGGSGHEPLHMGFVGPGMLDAAVAGPIFTSPTPDAILSAIEAVDHGHGVLCIVKNYTGDVLNFETAIDLAREGGRRVRMVEVRDDVAVEDSPATAGRRGIAGVLIVEKIVGAAAERGDDLAALEVCANRVNSRVRSIGAAFSAPDVPYMADPGFVLDDDSVEFGVGIHGEPGREQVHDKTADAVVDRMVEALLADRPLAPGSRVLLLVNGLGATPISELYIAHRRACEVLRTRGFIVERHLVGSFVTSLNMQGFSLTLFELDDDLVKLWDAPVQTAALRWGC